MPPRHRTVLVYGYGNPGRVDDGLGPALAREVGERRIEGVTVETAYQLQIEDAALVAEHDVVVFADADSACGDPFELRRVEPRSAVSFSSHSVAPAALLALAHEHFACGTVGFLLGIRGHQFDDFGERLSARAVENLAAAVEFMDRVLRDGTFEEAAVSSKARARG